MEDGYGPDDHAPPGYEFCLQCFEGQSKERAIREASRLEGRPVGDFIALRGNFDPGTPEVDDDGNYTWPNEVFRPDGWMVFMRVLN